MVENTDQRSRDYGKIKDCYRPGHADYTFDKKYGLRDYRGGGRTSGRETIGRVAGGAVASRILECLGIKLTTYTKAIGPVSIPSDAYDYSVINENRLYIPNPEYAQLPTCVMYLLQRLLPYIRAHRKIPLHGFVRQDYISRPVVPAG